MSLIRRSVRVLLITVAAMVSTQGFAVAGQTRVGVFGTWGPVKEQMFQVAKDNKFNIVVSNDVAKAASMNMQCLYPFWLTKEIAQDKAAWYSFLEKVRSVVSLHRNNPAVYGWYLADEPDWHDIPFDKLKELMQVIKGLDNQKPTFTVLTIPGKWYKYLPYFDIIGIDPYIDTTASYAGKETTKVQVWIEQLKRDFSKLKVNKPIFVVLGAFELRPKGKDVSVFRKPTAVEFNTMASICLQHKVAGILVFSLSIMEDAKFYGWDLTKDDPALWNAVKALPEKLN